MWHIPMIFMFWRGFSRNRHQPQPQPQPQPQQNEPVNIANINYPSSLRILLLLFNILNRAPAIQKRVYQGLHKSSNPNRMKPNQFHHTIVLKKRRRLTRMTTIRFHKYPHRTKSTWFLSNLHKVVLYSFRV